MRVSTNRHNEVTARQILPPIQIRTKGEPISVVDSVASTMILVVSLTFLAWVLGFDPRNL